MLAALVPVVPSQESWFVAATTRSLCTATIEAKLGKAVVPGSEGPQTNLFGTCCSAPLVNTAGAQAAVVIVLQQAVSYDYIGVVDVVGMTVPNYAVDSA